MDTQNKNKLPAIAFMIGMGRSGTTLLTNMLNSHPQVISTPENEFVLFAAKSFKDKDFGDESVVNDFMNLFNYNFHTEPSIWVPSEKIREDIKFAVDKSFVNICKMAYLNNPLAGQKQNVCLLVDKNPVYSLHTEVLHELFPDAKYVVLVRNYKDNVLSRKKYAYKYASIFELGVSWNFYYQTIFKTAAQCKLQMHILRYEDLVKNPKETLQKLCVYLGIDFKEEMLNYKEKAGEMKKYLKENTSGEKFDKVMQMHGNLESDVSTARVNAHEKELSEEENLILDYICYDTAKQFSYANRSAKPAGKTNWDLKKSFYQWKMNLYLVKQRIYYNLPVSTRLGLLKKK